MDRACGPHPDPGVRRIVTAPGQTWRLAMTSTSRTSLAVVLATAMLIAAEAATAVAQPAGSSAADQLRRDTEAIHALGTSGVQARVIALTGPHALAVDNGRTGSGITAELHTLAFAQRRQKPVRQRVEDLPPCVFRRLSTGPDRRNQRTQDLPLRIGRIRRVSGTPAHPSPRTCATTPLPGDLPADRLLRRPLVGPLSLDDAGLATEPSWWQQRGQQVVAEPDQCRDQMLRGKGHRARR